MRDLIVQTIMVADSSLDTRTVLKRWLELKGFHVVEATNGRQAVELTSRKCPDLILMSMRMPVLSGLDAAYRIRERSNASSVPIVAISTYPTREAQDSAFAAGCKSFIVHPIDFDGLGSILHSLLPEAVDSLPATPPYSRTEAAFSVVAT